MAVKTVIGEDAIGTDAFKNDYQFDPRTNDFVENDESYGNTKTIENTLDVERKKKIKSDIFTLLGSAIVNAVPIVVDAIKHHKDPVPYKVNKSQIARLGTSIAIPALQAIDTLALNSKLQNTLEEKTPIKLSDIRNVVNITLAYPSTKVALTNYMTNVSRQATGRQQVVQNPTAKRDAIVSCANVISPYIVDKFCDENLTFVEKCSSVLPIKIFGGLFKRFMSTDPKLQQVYDVGTTMINIASYGNNKMSSAVRSNNGRPSSAVNTLGTFLDIAQDMTGMSRGNISRFNDGYNGWNDGSRFNGF